MLDVLFFLIHINDLSENLVPHDKLFADDTFPLSIVPDITVSTKNLNGNGLFSRKRVLIWILTKRIWKLFFEETYKLHYLSLHFNNTVVN